MLRKLGNVGSFGKFYAVRVLYHGIQRVVAGITNILRRVLHFDSKHMCPIGFGTPNALIDCLCAFGGKSAGRIRVGMVVRSLSHADHLG